MKKNAKLAPLQTLLRYVAIFLHNADFPNLIRVTKPPKSHLNYNIHTSKTLNIPKYVFVNGSALAVYNCEL